MIATKPTDFRRLPELSAKLLPKFMDSKLAEYVEPTKKGTPKGEAVGFSRTKYKATLYTFRERVLDNTQDMKAQAKELGISYGLLRKWRSEQNFKARVSQHEKAFIIYVLKSVSYSGNARLDILDDLARAALLMQAVEPKQKGSFRKLMILIHAKIQDEAMRSHKTARQLRQYQRLALDQIIELLRDRQTAIKHRRDVINLLSGLRETLA
jgi:hypothetical protein